MKCLGKDLRRIIWGEFNTLDKKMLLMAHGSSRQQWNRTCALIALKYGYTKLLKVFGTDKLPKNACCFSKGHPSMLYTLLDLGLLGVCYWCIHNTVRNADMFRLRAFARVDGFERVNLQYLFTLSLEKSHWVDILEWFYDRKIYPPPSYVRKVIHKGRIDILEWMHERGLLYAHSPCREAVHLRNLEVVKWSRNQGYSWENDGDYEKAVDLWPNEEDFV